MSVCGTLSPALSQERELNPNMNYSFPWGKVR